ncbi:hypothetical protein [Bacillus cereus]|uniref:Uncharacterized protein n=1 Tax=Bacillus cereus TaxID=1396 RepID=A0A164QEM0_BACCE|nr:hypothetical protein [Bacillus cereus]KZD71209.1 hypothetical protein B4088_0939 [Bacillus cereus]HDR8321320.1 hypothetical protein [Bacillus cereus]HDR8331037.1 hypothetical protein [Bacillus cereus]HDR8334283.1 hypothetical protein [Bacillus cereus]
MLYSDWTKQKKISFHSSLSYSVLSFVKDFNDTNEMSITKTMVQNEEQLEILIQQFYFSWLRRASSRQHQWTLEEGAQILSGPFFYEVKPNIVMYFNRFAVS